MDSTILCKLSPKESIYMKFWQNMKNIAQCRLLKAFINRKEGNDQESIQLPKHLPSKTPKGNKDALKATVPQSKHFKQKAKRRVSFPHKKSTKRLSKIKKKSLGHTCKTGLLYYWPLILLSFHLQYLLCVYSFHVLRPSLCPPRLSYKKH